MSDHTEAGLQALLDTTGCGRGVRILKTNYAYDASNPAWSYYVDGGVTYPGRVRWVDVLVSATDAQANTAVRAALA